MSRLFVSMLPFLMLMLFSQQSIADQQQLDNGWQKFSNNDFDGAIKQFKKARRDNETKAEAFLALSLISWQLYKYEDAFDYFEKYFKNAQNPYPATFALWGTPCSAFGSGKKERDRFRFLKNLADDDQAPGSIRSKANYILGQHFLSSNEFDNAQEYFGKLESIEKWQLVGTFDNTSASGYDKEFGPLDKPKPSATFKDKVGAQVKWFTIPGVSNTKWVELGNHLAFSDAIAYAQTFVKSPVEQEVQLRIGTSGSLKAWANDQQVISVAEERNNDHDTYMSTIKLRKGYNRILLKIGVSELSSGNFMVRITDEKGQPIGNLETSAEYRKYPTETNYQPKRIPIAQETYFKEKIEQNPDKILNYLLLSKLYSWNDKNEKALATLLEAKELAPQSTFVRSRLINIYQTRNNRSKLAETLEWLREHDEENYFSLSYSYYEQLNNENYTKAEEKLDQLEDKYGRDATILELRVKLASKQEEMRELVQLIREAYDDYPNVRKFVMWKYNLEKEGNKDVQRAIEVLEDYLDDNFSKKIVYTLANSYFELGKSRRGYKQLESLIDKSPVSPGYYEKLVKAHYENQNYKKAANYQKQAMELAPYYAQYMADLGVIYKQMGKDRKAEKLYTKCINYNPNKYDIRKKLRKLRDQPGVFDVFKERDIDELYKNAPGQSKFPEENSYILVDDVQKVVYPEGGSEERHRFAVKVFDQKGIDNWKEYGVSYNPHVQRLIIEKAEVLKENGNKITAETNDNQVVFTNLEAGDAIHITYRFENYYANKLISHFWDKFYLSSYIPFRVSTYQLMAPKGKDFKHNVSNSNVEPEVEQKGDYELYTWERWDEDAVSHEQFMPPLTDVDEVLHISSFPDWNFISNWYLSLAETKAKAEYEVKKAVEQLFKDGSYTERQKAQKIYNYIVENISYSSVAFRQSAFIPQKASKTLNTRLGDCKDVSTLFVSMCKEAGLDAEWVLVNTRDNGYNDLGLPSIYFNHCIGKVTIDDKEYYVELTSDKLPMGSFSDRVENAFALEISPGKEEPMRLSPDTRVKNQVKRTITVSFTDEGMHINRKNHKTGAYAADMRDTYRDMGSNSRKKRIREAVSDDYEHYVNLDTITFRNLESTNDTVYYRYSFDVAGSFKDIGNMKLFELPWSEQFESGDFLSGENRKYPIALWDYKNADRVEQTLIIEIPDDLRLMEVPESLSLETRFGNYQLTYEQKDGKLIAKRVFNYKKERIPAEDYDAFKEFFAKVVEADSNPVAFKEK